MKKLRKFRGQAIVETGPALFVLLVLIFFPMMDLLAMGLQFCCGWYLNHEATHELSISKLADWTTALNQVKTKFSNSGIPKFAHMSSGTHTYTNVPADATGATPAEVNCKTAVVCKPFLYIPMFFPVPGVNQDMTISFTTVATWETFDKLDPTNTAQSTQSFSWTE